MQARTPLPACLAASVRKLRAAFGRKVLAENAYRTTNRQDDEWIRDPPPAVYTASHHAAFSCAYSNSNNVADAPYPFETEQPHAYA